MSNCEELISKLNAEQVKPVLDTEGAVLVIAGAGSGKTRVLTTRIAYLVNEKKVLPEQIMAITFTNKAASEMKSRLSNMVEDVDRMWVSTIHSMCVKILRKDIAKLGLNSNFTIYDEADKEKVLKRALDKFNLDVDKFLKTIKSHISTAKNECLSPIEYKKAYNHERSIDDICAVYEEYERVLFETNSLDFDDLLYKTYELFTRFPETASYYSKRFRYIHIDEFQDTNKVQFEIVKILAKENGNLFAVGDDDQSIYGWRGAKIENILSFDEFYKGAKVYKLQQNYRSTKKILSLANAIISRNTQRRHKELWTENADGVKVEVFVGGDENNEASFTALQIKNLMARTDLKYSDFAIFMRLNALSRPFEQEFMKYGIPCKIYGGLRFFERKEIKDVLAYLRVLSNPLDNESFLRCISVPKRGVGDKTLKDLYDFCKMYGYSLFDGIDMLEASNLSPATKKKLIGFKNLLVEFKEYSLKNPVADLIEHVILKTGFNEQFAEKSEENNSRLLNLSELKNSAEEFVKDNPNSNLQDYLASVTLSSDIDGINTDDAVTIATIHAAKGLEYKCVFVVGLDEKILPVGRSLDDTNELEEERRLMYVAITRAMQRLYLTRASSRYLYGKREYMLQSRFFREAMQVVSPEQANQTREYSYRKDEYSNRLYDQPTEEKSFGGYSSSYARKTFLENNKLKENKNAEFNKYKTGAKVKHLKFGVGTIINVKGEGENLIVNVAFSGVGIKALSVKYATIEIING